MLRPTDVFEILRAQSVATDVRFGDLAIEMGLLTRDDVMRLLMIQSDRKRPIGDILVTQGVLTLPQFKAEMAAYRRYQLQPKRPCATMRYVPVPLGRSAADAATESVTAV
jgi:hypothetical protein